MDDKGIYGGWIPCERKEPGLGDYLVTYKCRRGYGQGYFTGVKISHHNSTCWCEPGDTFITAWQELPEPYESEVTT